MRMSRERSKTARSMSTGTAAGNNASNVPARLSRASSFALSRLRTLLVPLDGSPFAERALPLAVDLAQRSGADLQIVHVHETPTDRNWRDRSDAGHIVRDFDDSLASHKESYLERILDEVRRESAISVSSRIVDHDDVASALCEVSSAADLVILAAHGKGLMRRWMSRDTAGEVIRNLAKPIVVVGNDGSFATAPPQRVRRILIALDGSRAGEQALRPALALADTMKAETILVRAVPISAAFGTLAYRSGTGELHNVPGRMQLVAAGQYLHRVAHRAKQHSNVVDSKVVLSHRSIARTIAANAEAYNVDLVAIATRKDASRRRGASTAERLVQFASCRC